MERTYIKVDLDALHYNVNNIKNKIGGAKLLLVIKADAYGHGAVQLAGELEGQCDFFGVACIEEALELVHHNIKTPILILGYVSPQCYKIIVEKDIRIPVFTYESAKALSDEAYRQGKIAKFHIAVDTGMSRIGFLCTDENINICEKICRLPNIEPEGIFTHFATADEKDLSRAEKQAAAFDNFVVKLSGAGVEIPIKHVNNSAGIINFSNMYDMVRCGIITYGLYPSEDVDKAVIPLKPVMSWYSAVSCVKELDRGAEVSYGGTYKITKKTTVATVAVGYADGYPRSLSNKGAVIINGKYAPVLGRVCMDQIIVDVTGIDNVFVETPVTLIGTDGGCAISMEELAEKANSFNYEQACRISRRVTRVYFKNSQPVQKINYL
ncbi:MAG: alanine racemase [Clostridiales bacterium]|nr:alanine racemase [Clostridiales bacterium]